MRMVTAALVALTVGAATAAGAVVPGATPGPATAGYRYQLRVGPGLPSPYAAFDSGSGPGNFNNFGADPGSGSTGLVTGYINYGSNPTLSTYAQSVGTGLAAPVLSLRYDFVLTALNQAAYDGLADYLALDPANGLTVTGAYAVSLSGNGSTDAGAYATIDAGFGETLFRCVPGDLSQCTNGPSAPYTVTGKAVGDPGTLSFSGTLLLGASVFVATGELIGTNQSGYAMIDPVISLPQGFVGNPANYVVAYSPNLTGGGTVPEPASWAMMLVGFGLVGGWQRRGRRRVRVVAA